MVIESLTTCQEMSKSLSLDVRMFKESYRARDEKRQGNQEMRQDYTEKEIEIGLFIFPSCSLSTVEFFSIVIARARAHTHPHNTHTRTHYKVALWIPLHSQNFSTLSKIMLLYIIIRS